jgi:hypothetical protein
VVRLAIYHNLVEADIAKMHLAAHDIEAELRHAHATQMLGPLGLQRVELWVQVADLEVARNILLIDETPVTELAPFHPTKFLFWLALLVGLIVAAVALVGMLG